MPADVLPSVVKYCADVRRRIQKRASRLEANGQRKAAQNAAHRLRTSFACRLEAAYRAVRSQCRFEETLKRRDYIVRLAKQANELSPASADLHLLPKADGQMRPVLAYDDLARSRQHLALGGIKPFARRHPALFTQAGGRSAACEALRQGLEAVPADWVFLQLDVRDFYPSLDKGWLERNLPYRRAVTRSVVLSDGVRVRVRSRPSYRAEHMLQARRGLPQGAVSSPAVADHVMAHLISEFVGRIGDAVPIVYADNIGILANPAECEDIESAIREAAQRFHGGPLEIRRTCLRQIRRGFRFLGAHFARRGERAVQLLPRSRWHQMRITYLNAFEFAAIPPVEENKAKEAAERVVRSALSTLASQFPCPRARSEHAFWKQVGRVLRQDGREAAIHFCRSRSPRFPAQRFAQAGN